MNFRPMDVLHIAMSEEGEAEYFITCDDNIIRKGKKWKGKLKTKIISVLEFMVREAD